MSEFTVIYEQANDGGWGAYAPELPGLGVVGETLEEAEALIRDGIKIYLDELKAEGKPLQRTATKVAVVQVPA
jgi:predicted RNase H-like HicB family nuclease